MEKELWITNIFNRTLAAPANAILDAFHYKHNAAQPWGDWFICEVLVVLFIVILFSVLRTRLSVDKPGKLQHIFELFYDFVRASSEEIIEHGAVKYVPLVGTIFLFIFFMNTLGLVPGFVAPTMFPFVPMGMALAVIVFYHSAGVKANGFGYIKQFLGPVVWLMPLLFPIEIASHMARPLSLTLRLYANMFAGEQVSDAFTTLTKLAIPVIFIALHAFACILQSYIFMMLAIVYIGGAVSHEH
jgi:F-type H+-transporting ATPase subunit a